MAVMVLAMIDVLLIRRGIIVSKESGGLRKKEPEGSSDCSAPQTQRAQHPACPQSLLCHVISAAVHSPVHHLCHLQWLQCHQLHHESISFFPSATLPQCPRARTPGGDAWKGDQERKEQRHQRRHPT